MQKKMEAKVLLISMPWTSLTEPSIGLGILKSELKNKGIKCKIKHFNIFLLRYLKEKTYRDIANIFAINDFVFTSVFEEQTKEQEEILKQNLKELLKNKQFFHESEYNTIEKIFDLIILLRNKIIPEFLNDCLKYVKCYRPTMVGFTCMYDQTIASLALSKMIYEWNPKILLCLGGYSVHGTIGVQILKSFRFIDCIVQGAGETCISSIALASIDSKKFSTIKNIYYREKKGGRLHICKYTNSNDINKSPIPDYYDFISDINELSVKYDVNITWNALPIVTSSGCWWGEKSHCVFCGINESYIKYKCKNEDKVITEIMSLNKTYKKKIFRIYDYILSNKYYNTLLPKISEYNINKGSEKIFFTCEIKSNITDEKFKSLKDANFLMVQPGIESFSTNILKKMHKGVRGIQNIYCLMLGVKYNIYIGYNILYGFPNDEITDYEQLIKIIPYIYHLFPPNSCTKIAITKDSPINMNGYKYGIEKYHHHPLYDCIFSKKFVKRNQFDIDKYCYYFEYPFKNSLALDYLYQVLNKQVYYWQTSKHICLYYQIDKHGITFYDGRYKDSIQQYIYNKTIADIYLACECVIKTKNNIISQFKEKYSTKKIEETIDLLISKRFILSEDNLILGLVFEKSVFEKNKKENNLRTTTFTSTI